MSSVGPSELIIIVVIGLLILGPERLPRVASQIGRWVGKARRTANQLRYQLEREVALADIEKSKKKDAKPKADETIAGSRRPADAGPPAEGSPVAPDAAGQPGAATEASDRAGAGDDSRAAAGDDTKPV